MKRLAGGPTTQVIFDMRGAGAGAASQVAPVVYHNGANFVYFTAGADRIVGGGSQINEWTSVAISRVSGTTRMYVNNVMVGSSLADSNVYINNVAILGGTEVVAGASMSGYMDEIRISLTGRYSASTYPVQDMEFPNF